MFYGTSTFDVENKKFFNKQLLNNDRKSTRYNREKLRSYLQVA